MKKITLGLSLVPLVLAGAAFAAPGAPGMQMKGPMANKTVTRAEAETGAKVLFDRMDANHDGKLDKGDREASLIEHFKQIDTDGNGSISQAEFLAAHQPGQQAMDHQAMGPGGMNHEAKAPGEHMGSGPDRRGGRAMMMLRGADTNKDGAISKAEFIANALKRFDAVDANKDGKISPQERAAAMKAMRERTKARRGMPGGDGPPPAN